MRRYDNVCWSKEEGDKLKGMGLGTEYLWTAHSREIGSLTQQASNSDKISKIWVNQFWQDLIHTSENKPRKEPKIHKGGSWEWNIFTKTLQNKSLLIYLFLCYLKRCFDVCFRAFWNLYQSSFILLIIWSIYKSYCERPE